MLWSGDEKKIGYENILTSLVSHKSYPRIAFHGGVRARAFASCHRACSSSFISCQTKKWWTIHECWQNNTKQARDTTPNWSKKAHVPVCPWLDCCRGYDRTKRDGRPPPLTLVVSRWKAWCARLVPCSFRSFGLSHPVRRWTHASRSRVNKRRKQPFLSNKDITKGGQVQWTMTMNQTIMQCFLAVGWFGMMKAYDVSAIFFGRNNDRWFRFFQFENYEHNHRRCAKTFSGSEKYLDFEGKEKKSEIMLKDLK